MNVLGISADAIVAIFVNLVLGAMAFGSLKADNSWFKRILEDYNRRLTHLEHLDRKEP